jgi:DNA-binding beta-propeller fold protein YncE
MLLLRARAFALTGMLAFGACLPASGTGGATPPPRPAAVARGAAAEYRVFVVSESSDDVALVRFGPDGARVERSHKTGLIPTEINGPHGIAVSPDGRWYYVSVAHGAPNGTLWKYSTANDSLAGRVSLGLFPASLQVTPDGAYAYVVNFNLHGDMVPSSVSVVDTETMLEVARIPTCTMPHGSRINAQGTRHYSVCMMDDMLVEIDTRRFEVSRHFQLAEGRGGAGAPRAHEPRHHAVVCSPTWAQPSTDGARVFVACNKSNEILEIDAASWTVSRRLPAGDGVYNLAASPDGRLLVGTNKRGRSVSVFEIASGRELARIPTTRPVVHGVAISPDSRYAFVTVEGVGSEPGTLEVLDLAALRTVASVDLGQQAAGVDFWRMTPADSSSPAR